MGYDPVPWIILYGNGGYAHSGGLPKDLYNKLNSRRKDLPGPASVALGPKDTWFIRWEDGKTEWDLPAKISDICNSMRSNGGDVTSVSIWGRDNNNELNFLVRGTAEASIPVQSDYDDDYMD